MEHTPSLLDQVRHAIRLRHYNYSTERTYLDWVIRFILANGKRHPRELGAAEQELLGHSNVKTTMIYSHVLNRGGQAVQSPMDRELVE